MKEFFKTNKYNLLIVLLVGLLIYSIRMIFYSISIDTEVLINNPEQLLNSWMSIGRFGLVGIKKLFNLVPININLTNIFTFIIFYISIVIWMMNVEKFQKVKNKYSTLVFALVLIASPIFAEQFGFTLQSLEMSIAFLLLAIGINFQEKYLNTNKIWYVLITILLLVISFMCYQAFIFLYITICAFDYFVKYKGKIDYKLILKYILIYIISLVIYYGLTQILTNVLNIEKTPYLLNQIDWAKGSFFGVLLKTIVVNIVTTNIFMGIVFDIILIITFVIITKYLLSVYKIKQNKMFYLVYIFLFISPFLSGIIKGSVEMYRAKFSLAFFIAFMLYYLVNNFGNIKNKKFSSIIKYFVIFTIIVQILISFSLFFIDYQRYKDDVETGNKINEIIQKMDKQKIVVFVGKKEYKKFKVTGETLGHSFFEWDANEAYGVNFRVNGFLKTINIDYNIPSLEDIQKVKDELVDMPIWPEEGSIIEREKCIIVNLGK